MRFDGPFIAKAIPNISIVSDVIPKYPNISIDTRTLVQGNIFVALPGTHVDGHDFIQEALKKGASGLLIAETKKDYLKAIDKTLLKKLFVAVVPDTYQALLSLARAWRVEFQGPVIAITGSIGKTSTKQRIEIILKHHGENVFASAGTQNTFIGIALNILKLRPEHTVGLFEIGISKRGEMAQKSAMVNPTSAVITYIGHSHMEGLGSIIDIAAEKRDIFKHFKENNIGIINGDIQLLSGVSYPHPMIKFGTKTTNQIQARKIQVGPESTSFVLKVYKQRCKVQIPSSHAGVVSNILASVAVATQLGVPLSTIAAAIEKPISVPGRYEKRELKNSNGIIINDAYNASPESMKAALLAFQTMNVKGPKIVVLGDMLELGVNSPFWHRQLGRVLRKTPTLRDIILVGDLVQWTKKTAPVGCSIEHVATWKEAVEVVKKKIDNHAAILVKGSRGIGLTNLVDSLTAA